MMGHAKPLHTNCRSLTEPSGVDTEGGVIESEDDVLARHALCMALSSGPGPPARDGKSDSEDRLRLGAR